ncbi:MAG: T9SS type A sorting domain-containing protein [Bacteroidota bacterium]
MTKRDYVKGKRGGTRIKLRPRVVQKFQLRKVVIFASCLLFVSGFVFYVLTFTNVKSAFAGTSYTWNGSVSYSWDEPLNWTPNGIPDTTDLISVSGGVRSLILESDRKITNLTCNNSSNIDLNGFELDLSGNFISNPGSSIELNGGTLSISGNATFNGGTISDSDSTGLVMTTGSSCVFGNSSGGATLNSNINVRTSNVTLRSTTFNRGLVIEKRGSGSDNSYGGNTFNGITEIINNGTGNLLFSNNAGDVFNNIVTFTNNGSAGIYPAYNDTNGTFFNDSIYVNCTAGAGIFFSAGTGNSFLAENKRICTGLNGFSAGTLSLRHFSTPDSIDQNLILTGAAIASLGPTTYFGNELYLEATGIRLNGATFASKVTLTKTGAGNNQGTGGNIFNDSVQIINSGSGYFLTGNSLPDTFHSAVSISNPGTGDIYLAHNSAGNIFNGTVTIRNSGSGSANRVFICEGNNVASAIFNGEVNLFNSSSGNGAIIRFNLRGTSTFKDNIFVNSTVSGTSGGISFGASGYTGTTVMDSLHSIYVGPDGFSSGTLSLVNFTKPGTDSLVLELTGTSGIAFGPGSVIGGDVVSTSGSVSLNGCSFYGLTRIIKTGASNDLGSGRNIFYQRSEISNTGSGSLGLANSAADTFLTDVSFINSGSGNLQVAHNSTGNLFNGKVSFNNTGSGANNRMFVCEGNTTASAVFNDTVFINNHSTALSAYLRFNLRGTTFFNEDIVVSSTGGTNSGTNGIYFGWPGYPGSSVLSAGKHLLIGTGGYTKGVLSLIKFSKLGVESDSLSMGSGSSVVLGPNLIWNGNLSLVTGGVNFNGGTFSNDVSVVKTGTTSETSTGGNLFGGRFTITNQGTGNLVLGNSLPDTFSGEAIFNNSGTSYMQIANGSAGNVFNDVVRLNNSGSGTDNRILLAEGSAAASIAFASDVFIKNNSTATTALIRFNLRGTSVFNGNIELSNNSGTGSNCGIYFGLSGYNGSATLADGKNIRIGTSGFINGSLHLVRFTQHGNQPDSLLLSSSSTLTLGPLSRLGGNVTSTSGSLFLNGCIFDGTTDLRKTGTTNDNGSGANTFSGNSTITNSGSGYLLLGNSSPDQFSSDLNLNNTGTSYIYIGHNSSGNQFNGTTVINNAGTGSDTRILIGEGNAAATNSFNGDVLINNISTSADGLVRFNLRGTTTFSGNITLNSTLGSGLNNGIAFGWPGYSGSATLATGKTITTGATGFSKGTLLFQNFTQLGTEALSFLLSGTGVITFGNNSVFRGKILATSPDIYLNGTTFNDTAYFEKTGNNNINCAGGNVFERNSILVNSGTGTWLFSNTSKDIYNGELSLRNNSSGSIYLAHNDASGTRFNDNLILTNISTGSIRFGQGTGTCSLADGKIICFSPSGFGNGVLYLRNFSQIGTMAQSLSIPTGSASIYLQTGTTFNGPLTVNSPQLFLNGSVFNGATLFNKNGSVNNSCNGGNTFNGNTTIKTSGTGNLYLANSTPDNFNASVLFIQDSSGILFPAYNGMNNFRGDVSTIGSDTIITFAAGSGTVNFAGFGPQNFYGDSIHAPRIRRMSMNNSAEGLTLNVPVNIYGSLALVNGQINTSLSNLLILANGISAVSSVSDLSFVNGPVRKIGNQSFIFPVGKNGRYRPIGLSAPGSSTDQYTAEYFYSDPNTTYNTSSRDASLNNVSRCEFWTLTKTGGASNPVVNVTWNTNSCGVSSVADLRVVRWDTGTSRWRDMGNASATGTVTSGSVLASVNSSNYGIYSIGSTTPLNVLPIELSDFDAQLVNGVVNVIWETMSEINNDYFTVERSSDGYTFSSIGIVSGSGNSTTKHNYSLVDNDPLPGLSYYRLIQTDYDGKFEVFEPRTVKNIKTGDGIKVLSIMPNPFNDRLTIRFDLENGMQLSFELYSMSGNIVAGKELPASSGTSEIEFDQVGDLPQGVYILKILTEGKVLHSERVIKN